MMLERLQDYRRLVYRVAVAKHYVTTQAGNVVHYDGKPVLDDAPVLQAVDRLLKTDDTEAKLLGLYAPAKSASRSSPRTLSTPSWANWPGRSQ